MYPSISFLGSNIYTYNLFIGFSIITALLFYNSYTKKLLPVKFADNLLVCAVISMSFGFLFALIFNKMVFFEGFDHFKRHLLDFSGMTFLGGLLGGAIVFLFVYKLIFKDYKLLMLSFDALIPSLILAHSVGRIGCFLGGCCFGMPFKLLGVYYPVGSLAYEKYGSVPIFPIQLFEAAFLFYIFLFFILKLKKNLLIYYLLMYGAFRFIVEFFRGDYRGVLFTGSFSPSQFICILMIALGLFINFIILRNKKHKKPYIDI